MLITNGRIFQAALDAINFENAEQKKEAKDRAIQIVTSIVKLYKKFFNDSAVGATGTGKSILDSKKDSPVGLAYGKIQSGKTRAMITSAALAFDNHFRIIVVVTTDINRLVQQTQQDFIDGLPEGVVIYTQSEFESDADHAKQILNTNMGGIMIVCSKGAKRLPQAIEFLKKILAKDYPALIFDDEGDQATLDTKNLIRSTKKPDEKPSTIHSFLHMEPSIRKALPHNVFMSVTGTPQGIVLQNIDNESRPDFIELIEPGVDYIGGDEFFANPNPIDNKLIHLIETDEKADLLKGYIPDGLQKAILYFLLASSAASVTDLGWPKDNKGFKFLCHPSFKIKDQKIVDESIRKYLDEITNEMSNASSAVYSIMKQEYEELKNNVNSPPPLTDLIEIIRKNIIFRRILLINKNTTRDQLNYSRYFNFLIGGNTLGRGLAIRNLLVTYYVRESKKPQMDTVFQHARMFGYRKPTLNFTKVFLPLQLYTVFREIYISDEQLREYIFQNGNSVETLPVKVIPPLKATRSGVLDITKIAYLIPGRQILPQYPFFEHPKAKEMHDILLPLIQKYIPDLQDKTERKRGIAITIAQAEELLKKTKTQNKSKWTEKKMISIVNYLKTQTGDNILLKYRDAKRKSGDMNGLLEQGVLAGEEKNAEQEKPVLWLISTSYDLSNGNIQPTGYQADSKFIYPTLILPKNIHLTIYNES